MNAVMQIERGRNDAVIRTHGTMNLSFSIPAVRSAFLPYGTGIKANRSMYLAEPTTDNYDEDDLEVQMILKNRFVPIIQEQETKFFNRDEPSPVILRHGKEISSGEYIYGSQKCHGNGLFGDERKTGLPVDDQDATFMGFDYIFKDEYGFPKGKLDDLPFWRGD